MNAFHLFTLAGIPVRATMGFVLLAGYYGFSLRGGGLPAIGGWLVALVVSVLVHEFGHALVARRYRLAPQVVLHGWGGLCAHQPAASDRQDALIIVSGPLAGLGLAGIVAILHALYLAQIESSAFLFALYQSMWRITFWWSLVNLLPLFPLDGGQLFRLGLLRVIKPARKAERIVFSVALGLAVAGIAWAVYLQSLLLGFLSAFLLFQNFSYLQRGSAVAVRARSSMVDDLLARSVAAMSSGDPHEARRLAYQARDERNVAPDQVQRAFELLAVTSAQLEDWEETLDWAKRANVTPAIDEARVVALIGLGRLPEARHTLGMAKLGTEARGRVERLLAAAEEA